MLCQWNKSVVKSLSISFWRKKIERIIQYDSFHLKKFNIDIIWGIWGGGEDIGL